MIHKNALLKPSWQLFDNEDIINMNKKQLKKAMMLADKDIIIDGGGDVIHIKILDDMSKKVISKYKIEYLIDKINIDINNKGRSFELLPFILALLYRPTKQKFNIYYHNHNHNHNHNHVLLISQPTYKNIKTSISNLQKFHNNIKKNNLIEVLNKLKKAGISESAVSLLDLGSGKGNDMNRWYDLKINNVVGIDISTESIDTAYKRFMSGNYRKSYSVNFFQSDIGMHDKKLYDYLDNYVKTHLKRKFDIVSCNFAIHYFFRSPEALINFFTIIKKYLKRGGYFIGTALNKDLILNLMRKNDNSDVTLPLLELKPLVNFYNNNTVYNRKYSIKIGNDTDETTYFSNGPSIEYLVDFGELRKVALQFELKMINVEDFEDIYKKSTVHLSPDEKPPSFLNSRFIFYHR